MKQLIAKFTHIFGNTENTKVYYSPGRINIIGEHIDYNGGYVFPAAISMGTYGVVSARKDHQIRLYSHNYKAQGIIIVELSSLAYQDSHGWANYAKGIINLLKQRGYKIPFGFDLYVEGNLPIASGLSSSASLEVLVAYIANDIYQLNISRVDLALLSQEVENDYMGMHCGIMDQLIIACGMKDKALLMNTVTLEMEASNATFEGYQWVIMNTNYQRKTTDSKYNERREECEQALSMLQSNYQIQYLCELSPNDLPGVRKLIHNDILYLRAKHAITEQARTKESKLALSDNDVIKFAKLLNQSHESLKNDFDVTGMHLDTLVETALAHGAIGARVTGAGFGGCAVALVENKNIERMKIKVKEIYLKKTGLNAEFYDVTFVDGASEVK
ncbi:MAG: galactokinase [Firmicutes bacterium]|nr:galactokinase [Bacillota bacterium]